jgi:DNA-binding beta-propeller fold protein YncE
MSEGNRVALIVACDRYSDPELKQLRAPSQDAESFARLLQDPTIGGFKVTTLINEPHGNVTQKLNAFLQSCNRQDTLLLYFSCHGIKDIDGQLYFATITTNRTLLLSTAIESNFVNRLLDRCKAQQKVVLLDCCYSGAYEKGRVVKADTRVNATDYFGRGRVIITASDSMQYAFEGDDKVDLGKGGSYFTDALIEGLQTGKADVNDDGKITYSELYNFVYDYVKRMTPNQTPTLNAQGVEGDFVLFKNILDNPQSGKGSLQPSGTRLDISNSTTETPKSPMTQDPILEFVEKASVLLEDGNYDNAIKIFDTILLMRPGHIEALNGKGVALCNQERYEEALQCFNEVLKKRPRHPYASTYVRIIEDRISKEHNIEAKAYGKDIERDAALEKRTEEKVIKALNESTQTPAELIGKGDELLEKRMYQSLSPESVTSSLSKIIIWGYQGSGNAELDKPNDVAVDPTGKYVYVVEYYNHRIQKFDSEGRFITKWKGNLSYPRGIAIDPEGKYIFVADTYNHRIQKFDSEGRFILALGSAGTGDGQFDDPKGLAVDPYGNLYVADDDNHRIQKFDRQGGFITKWGSNGNLDGQFDKPNDVAVDPTGKYVYVVEYYNHRIQKFDSEGRFITKWGSNGSKEGQLSYPKGIAVDRSGYVYVADTDNHRIQKFDSEGKFILALGSEGKGEGQFKKPNGLAFDLYGNLYVADDDNYRIQKIGSDRLIH